MDAELLNRMKTILRRDLKLGPDANIPDDMAFFGGEFDLDSLDVLLLLTSIEKEFGLKIPNEAVGQAVFKNVTTLAQYIAEHTGGAAAPAAGPAAVSPAEALSRLPHAEPFRFVSRVDHLVEGQEVKAAWSLTGREAFFTGHFPGRPLVPGVLIAEALAQASGLIAAGRSWRQGKLAQVDVRFEQPVSPPAEILLESRLSRAMGPLQLFDVLARQGDAVVARGTVALKLDEGAPT